MSCHPRMSRGSLTVVSFCVTSSMFFCSAELAGGQVTPGTPSFSAYDSHQYDMINLQSLNVSLKVPVMSKSGAIPFRFGLMGAPSYMYSFYAGGGVTYIYPGEESQKLGGYVNGFIGYYNNAVSNYATATSVTCPSGDGNGAATKYSNWYVGLPDGTMHSLPATDVSYSGTSCSGGFTDQVIDGTGYTLSVTGGTVNSVYARDGTNLSNIQTITDSHGNSISWNGIKWTDTLGIVALDQGSYGNTTWTWTDVNGGTPTASLTNTSYTIKTAFGCPGLTDSTNTAGSLPTAVNFPDSTALGLAWEATPGFASNRTGRLSQITMRDGSSTVAFNYNPSLAANDGLNCTYLIPNKITRTTSDGTTTYVWAHITNGNTTTVTDPGGNNTVYTFINGILTQVKHYQGSSTLLTTDVYCYNAATGQPGNCATAVVSLPVTEVDVYHTISGMTTSSRSQTKFDSYGNTVFSAQYDFGATSFVRQTSTVYGTWNGSQCVAIGNSVNNKPCNIWSSDGTNTFADALFTYDAHGNLLTTSQWNGSSWVGNPTPNVYNTNGTIKTAYDLSGNQTTYTYDSASYTSCSGCTNYPFPTSISKGGLTTYSTWNGTGGVKLTDKDASGNTTTYGYTNSGSVADPFWRVNSVTDPLTNKTWKVYPPVTGWPAGDVETETALSFGSSTDSTWQITDGYGRLIETQHAQSPTGTTFDTVSNSYGWSGNYRSVFNSIPCSVAANAACTTGVTTLFEPLGRPYTAADSGTGNGVMTNTYTQNDVLSVLTPAPSGENSAGKQVQKQHDGLGRLKSSCQISTTAPGNVLCNQNTNTSAKGVLTTVSYTTAQGSQTVSSTRGSQTRSAIVDAVGRVTSSTTPEGGTIHYYYDSYNGVCGFTALTEPGHLVYKVFANGNNSCYLYDTLGRETVESATIAGSGVWACRKFFYDNSTGYTGTIPAGITISNSMGRVVEAATDNCSGTLVTDEWFSYDKDGHMTDMWQKTPHSGMYYHSVATFAGNGAVTSLNLANSSPIETSTYGLDGEGRPATLVTYGQTIVTGTSFNAASQPTNIDIGTGTDQDAYVYDPNTGRMTNWTFYVGSQNETGALTWNPNGTLKKLAITDGFNAGGTQTCHFNPSDATGTGYDDLVRLIGADCGSGGWGQTFSFDQYNNITKAVISGRTGVTWNPGYSTNPSNNHYNIGSYDTSGNLLNDTMHQYTWDEFNKLKTVDSSACGSNGECLTYDAFGQAVEISNGSAYTEIWYTQLGKTAYMNGSAISYAYWPAPGGATLLQSLSGGCCAYYFQHKDWLGSARIVSAVRTVPSVYADRAFAPYGEMYQNFGSTSANALNFTGDTQDIVAGTYDTPNRELNPNQGRWLSPDPAGAGWNQYAYVDGNPLSYVDPLGLFLVTCKAEKGALLCFDFTGDGTAGMGFADAITIDASQGLGGGFNFSFNFGGIGCDSDFIPCGDLPTSPGQAIRNIWDILGLPSGLNCPQMGGIFGQLCGGVSPSMDATKKDCISSAVAENIRVQREISNRSPYETAFYGAIFGLSLGGIAGCLNNVWLCEATEGASSVPGAIKGAASGFGVGLLKWITKNMIDSNVADHRFQQQLGACNTLTD